MKTIPVVIMTSHGNEQLAVEIMKAGALDYIVKSEDTFRDLPHIVERTLHHWSTVTEFEKAQTALEESEERYRTIVETANEGIWLVDDQSVISYVNRKMTDLLGVPHSDIIGRRSFDFIFPEDLNEYKSRIERWKQGTDESYEQRFRCSDGDEIWFLVSTKALINEEGIYTGSYVMFTDITERKKNEEHMKQAIKQINQNMETLSILNDQIRNPLSIMLILLDDLNDPSVDMIKSEITHIDAIINQLDKGWIESDKVRSFLKKHYGMTFQD